MTTHEMILLCSSLQGVKRCIPLCLIVGVATFGKFWVPPTYGLKHAAAGRGMPPPVTACCAMPRHTDKWVATFRG